MKEVVLKKLRCTNVTTNGLQIALLESRSLLALCVSNSIKSLMDNEQFKDRKLRMNDLSDEDSYTIELNTEDATILRVSLKATMPKDCSNVTPIIMYEVSDRALELNKVIEEITKAYC